MPNNIKPEGDDQVWKKAVDTELQKLREEIQSLRDQLKGK